MTMCAVLATPFWTASGRAQTQPAHLDPELHKPFAAAGGPDTNDQDVRTVHRQLDDVLQRYPPAVGQILGLDPSLMSNPTYLAAYPALQAFLTAHPDVAKNPTYYFEEFSPRHPQYQTPAQGILEEMLGGTAGLIVFGTVVAVVTWLIRLIVDYRRWNRLAKVQADAHTKLLDRFTANDELIAYVQSPAGSQFLQSAPIALDPGSKRLGAPISRILWSAQAGLVVMMGGLALRYVSGQIDPDAQQPVYALGMVALAVGVGFLLSAVVAYVLSHRLGLFDPAPLSSGRPSRPPEA